MAIPKKVLQQDEDSTKGLEGIGTPPPAEPPAESPTPAEPPTPEPPKPPETGEVDALKAEVDRLKRILADANSPTWEQRYHGLQGSFSGVKKELETVKAELEELKKKPAPAPELTEGYDTLVAEVGEKTANILKPYLDTIKTLTTELETVRGDVSTAKESTETLAKQQAQTAEERFMNSMTPEAKQVTLADANGFIADKGFSDFLMQRIPGTPYQRVQYYQMYLKELDASGINEIVSEYQKSIGKVDPPEPPKPSTDAEQYLEPGKTGGGAPPPKPPTKKTYSQAEFNSLMKDVTIPGRFKGTSAEKQALADELRDAELEGRVR